MREAGWRSIRDGRSRLRQLVVLGLLGALLAGLAAVNSRLTQRGDPAGTARVIDGDSLVVAGREIRLEGIDAPEGRQTCMRGGASWPCGEAASRHLAELIDGRSVRCRSSRADQHDRQLATCEAGGRSLNAAMVEDGYALAYGRYQDEEARARAARRGLWSGEFERPRDWRDRHPRR